MTDALYLYGLALWAHHKTLEQLGTGVELLQYANLAAVYQPCSSGEFDYPDPAADAPDTGDSRVRLLEQIGRHDAITQAASSAGAFFPTRFATLYSGRDALLNFMSVNHSAVDAFLQSAEGHREWAVKGYVRRERARDFLLAQELTGQSDPAPSSGQGYFREKQVALKMEKQVTQWLQKRAQSAITELVQLATNVIKRPLPASDSSETTGECFGNWALLLPTGKAVEFRQTLDDINVREQPSGIEFGCTGPWALYSFSQNVPIKN